MTLFDELGGDSALVHVVSEFYDRASRDEITSIWFRRVSDPQAFKSHMCAYLAVLFDGPELYVGRSMRHTHAGFEITPAAFDSVLARFGEAFVVAGIEPDLLAKVQARLVRLRAAIVDAPPLTGSHDLPTTRHL
jgi:hemoglobin